MKVFLVSCWIVLVTSWVNAQPTNNPTAPKISVHQFTTKDGLSHNAVNSVYQDSRNLYWIATSYGLNRFDGHEFKLYTKEKNGIHSNILDITFEDKNSKNNATKGMIWLLTGGSVSSVWFTENTIFQYSIFDPYTEQVIDAKSYLGEELYNHLQHISHYERKKDHLLLRTTTGHFIKYYHREKVEIKELKTNLKGLSVYKELSNHSYWVGNKTKTHQNLQLFSKNNQLLQTHKFCFGNHTCENQATCRGDLIPTITYDDNDSLWFDQMEGTASIFGLNGLLPTGEIVSIPYHTLIPNLSKNQKLRNIYHDATNNYFWLTDNKNKTYIVHPQKKLIHTLDIALQYLLLQDKQGTVWAKNTEGLYAIRFSNVLFKKHVENTATRGIVVDNQNRIWTYPNRIEGLNSVLDSFNFRNKSILASLSVLKDNEGTIWSFCYQSDKLWLGRFDDTENGKATLLPVNLTTRDIWSIYKDEKKGIFWGGGIEGLLFNYNPKTKKTTVLDQLNGIEAFKKATVYQIKPYQKQYFWLATSNGLYLLDKDKGIVSRYWNEGETNNFLPSEAIHHIYVENKNTLWLGSRSSGLLKVEIINDNKTVQLKLRQHFTIADGLPSNSIHAIYENPEADGYLWLNTENGIAQFHKTANFSTNFSKKNGLAHTEGNRISHFQSLDGRLYFGTINGVTSFHPNDFLSQPDKQKRYIHVVDLEQFSQATQQMESRLTEFQKTQKIILPSKEGRIELRLSQPFIIGIQNVFYTYQIKGLNAKQISLLEPKLTISDVPYGKYTLVLKALNSKGELLEERNIPLISKPPFYLQWWFLLGVFLVSGLSVYFFYQKRTRNLLEQKATLEKEVRQRTKQLEADKVIIEQQAEELKQLDETKSRFFANVSHELRTPIQLIQGPIQSVLKNNQLDNRNTTLLKKAKRNSNSLLKLVNEILDLTKLDANKLVLNEKAVVLYPFLRRIINNFQSIADTKLIHFNFIFQPKENLQIDLDTDKFEKIINNLLTNAFKFTSKGGRVEVFVKVSDTFEVSDTYPYLELSVKDNGRGIPEADIQHIFDRFYQSASNKKAEGGLGIGLALSMEFVKLMNGKMWVESNVQSPNQGSTFHFKFPKKEVMNIVKENYELGITNYELNKEIPLLSSSSEKIDFQQTILLVEDNHDLRDYIQFLLAPYYNVIAVENGQEALKWLTNHQSLITNHLIISDIMMPVMDGFEFLQQVKANEEWRLIPFIMLTARADMKDKIKALRIGVDDYLLKPFKEEELLVRIENLLTNAEERKAFSQVVAIEENIEKEENRLSEKEEEWLEAVENIILKHLTDGRFSVDFLAELLDINRKTLYQKTKMLIGLTPNQYIRATRLQYAKRALENGKYTSLKAASQDVGFRSPDYFSKLFVNEFGKNPMEYL